MTVSYEHIRNFLEELIPKAFVGAMYEDYYAVDKDYSRILYNSNPKPKNVKWLRFEISILHNSIHITVHANKKHTSNSNMFACLYVSYEVKRTNKQKLSFYDIEQKHDAPFIRYFLEKEIMKFQIQNNTLDDFMHRKDLIKLFRKYIMHGDYKMLELVCDYYKAVKSNDFVVTILDGLLAYKSVVTNLEAKAYIINLRGRYFDPISSSADMIL